WALTDYPLAGGAAEIGGLLYLRNEGPNAAVYMLGLAEDGPPLVPPRPNPMLVPESGTTPFLADLLLANGGSKTVTMTVTSDGDPTPLNGISDTLTVQVCPPIPPIVNVAVVPPGCTRGGAPLHERQGVVGWALQCGVRDAQWVRELDWALTDYPLAGGAAEIGGLLYLRNEGPNAAVYMLGLAEDGPPLIPPRPNPMLVPESGTTPFLADLLLANGVSKTVTMTVTSDGDPTPLNGISDTLTVQVCPPTPPIVNVAVVPPDCTVVRASLTETQEVQGVALKCVVRDAQWVRELDWAFTRYPLGGGAGEIGGLVLL